MKSIDLKYKNLAKLDDTEEPLEPLDEDPLEKDGNIVFEYPVTDILIYFEVLLPQGGIIIRTKVKGHTRGIDGDIVGEFDNYPMLNTTSGIPRRGNKRILGKHTCKKYVYTGG